MPTLSNRRQPLRTLRRLWPWAAAVATGLLLTLCFPPFNQGWLVWIALTPLLAAVWSRHTSRRRAAGLGYVAGLVFFAGAFEWLRSLAELFRTPALHGLSVLLGLYMGIYFAFWAWFVGGFAARGEERFVSSPRNLAIGFLAASAWVAAEWFRGWFLYGGWGWNGLGVALHRDLALIQIADVTGVLGLSWLVAFCNVMAVIVVRRILAELGPNFLKRIRWEFSFTMAVVALVFAYGVRALLRPVPVASMTLRVAAIQPNIPQRQKDDPEAQEEVFAQILQLTTLATAGTPKPQLVLWPEAATPGSLDRSNVAQLFDHLERDGVDLLTGTLDYEPDAAEPGGLVSYNAAAYVTRDRASRPMYRKMHLVPFGEFLPLRAHMPEVVQDLVPGDLGRGAEASVFSLAEPAMKLGVLICFEDTLGNLTRGFVQKGADVLVNLTNDGWFLHTAAAEQHLANAVFRAIESRRPLLRCANTGVTCLVDPAGRINRGGLPKFAAGFTQFTIHTPADAPLTFYTRHGDWIAHLSSGVVLACLAVGAWWRLRRNRGAVIEPTRTLL